MKPGFYLLFVLSLEFCSSGSRINDAQKEEQSDLHNSDSVLFEPHRVVNQYLNGFNTANLFHHFQNEPDALKFIEELNPRILRFPGGTVANFYHFHGPGYGYKEIDLHNVSGNMHKNARKSFETEQRNISKRGITRNFIVDFVELARNLNAQVLIVANLLNEEDEDILAMIKFFIKEGIPIAGLELGNEYYFKGYQESFPNVDAYIARSKRLVPMIRDLDPRIKIGVVAANSAKLKGISGPRKLFFEEWNRKLGKEDFYDAYIKHIYAVNKQCDNEHSLELKMKCQLGGNSSFIKNEVTEALVEFKSYYGQKPMWITEWNVKDVFKNLGNTFLQGLYYADFMFFMMEHPEIEIATYHNLLAKGAGFNMIGQKSKEEWDSSGKYSKRAPYEIAKLLAPLFVNKAVLLDSKVHEKDEEQSQIATKFIELKNGQKMVFIINKSGQLYNLNSLSFPWNGGDYSMNLKSIWSDSLHMGEGDNEWIDNGEIHVNNINLPTLKDYSVKGYSVTRIIYEK